MESAGIVPNTVKVEVEEPKEERTDAGSSDWIDTLGESALNEATEEEFFPDWVQEHGGECVESKKAQRRKESTHLFEVEVVANADAPVVRRVAIDGHSEGEKDDAASRSGKSTDQNRRDSHTLVSEANLAATGVGEEKKGHGPQEHCLGKEQFLKRPGAEDDQETDGGYDAEDQ